MQTCCQQYDFLHHKGLIIMIQMNDAPSLIIH